MTPRRQALAGLGIMAVGALIVLLEWQGYLLSLVGLVVFTLGLRRAKEPGAKVSAEVIEAGLVADGDRPGPGVFKLKTRDDTGRAFNVERDGAA